MGLTFDNYNSKCKVTHGGIKRIYLMPFVKYNRTLINDSEMSLTKFPASYIYKFECVGSYNQQNEVEEGSYYFYQNISINLSEVYNEINIHNFLKTDFRVIVETNNNDLIMFGVYNGLSCKVTNTSGTNRNEFNGFSLDFTGKEEKAGLIIDSLDNLGLYEFDKEEVFNYDFNFNI